MMWNIRHGRVHSRRNRGFTLLETLVALTLLGLVLMMLYGALFSAARSARAGDAQARENDDKRLALSFIRRVTGEAVPMLRVDEQGARLLFRGDDASLQFVSRLPAHHAGSGLYFLKLEVADDELRLNYTPLTREKAMLEEDIFVEADTVSLLEGVEAIDLDYFGRDTPDAEPAWHDEWDDKARLLLPELIRFKVIAGVPGAWPPLVVAVRAQAVRGQAALTLHGEPGDAGS